MNTITSFFSFKSVHQKAILVLILAFFLPTSSQAMTRHCQSYYEAVTKTVNGAANRTVVRFGYFETSGTCGSNVPDRCRNRAIETAGNCVTAHWRDRAKRNKVPNQCKGGGIHGYAVWDIKDELEIAVCCSPGAPSSQAGTIVTEVWAATVGPSSCRAGNGAPKVRQRLESNYEVNCASNYVRRLCAYRTRSALMPRPHEPDIDRPGDDINPNGDLLLGDVNAGPKECQRKCREMNRCKAWTFVTGSQRCFLKDQIPKAVDNSCCTSGVK